VETTALGAAALAGIARGVWATGADFLAASGAPTVFQPRMDAAKRAALLSGWGRAVHAAKAWAEHPPTG
jgi:glycerol kinase